MRMSFACMQCQVEGGPDFDVTKIGGSEFKMPIQYRADVLEGGYAKFTCRNGHTMNCTIQGLKPEVLAATAGYAIIDGYYREAVTSFTAALERLYELYVQVVSKTKSVDENSFTQTWKLMSKQSERQFGAFAMLYLNEEGSCPPHLTNSQVSFRNDVVHKGAIPSKSKTIAYGKSSLETMHSIALIFREKYKDSLSELVWNRLKSASEKRNAGEFSSSMAPAYPADIQGINANPTAPDLDNWLDFNSRIRNYG